MVEYHIQNDADPVLLQLVNQLLQLVPLMIMLHHGRIARIGRKEADRIIAPVIIELYSVHNSGIFHLVKFKNRHQLHGVDSQILQIGNLLTQSLISPPGRHSGGFVLCKSSHMHFIDNQILQGSLKLPVLSPVKIILHDSCVIHEISAALRTLSPVPLSRYSPGVWIQQNIVFVKKQPFLLIIGAVKLKCILKLLNVQAEYQHGVCVSYSIGVRKSQPRIWFLLLGAEKQQGTARSSERVNGKANPIAGCHRAIPAEETRPHHKTIYDVQRL